MELFWAQGYEGVSLVELQKAMGGITAPSFYNSFGSKEKLFREAVAHYGETCGAPPMMALMSGATARASIEAMLRAAVDVFTQPGKPRGCMVMLGGLMGSHENQPVHEHVKERRCMVPKTLRARIQRGVPDGDLPKSTNVAALTAFYSTFLAGLALRARDGASRTELNTAVDGAMAAWDSLAGKRN